MTNKVTLITGTSKGIGSYLACHYLNQGHIVVGCSRSAVQFNNKNYHHATIDITSEDEVKNLISTIKNKFGRLDHLINNAGIRSANHLLLMNTKQAQAIFATNFFGTFLLCRESAKIMLKHRFGRIINFVSVAVPLKVKSEAVYAASKAAVNSLTQILAIELGNLGITVNAVGPALVKTDMITDIDEKMLNEVIKQQAIPRLGECHDVANVVDFYLSEHSHFITGQTVYLGGIS